MKIEGVPALLRKLDRLEKSEARKANRAALTAATKDVLKALRAATPRGKTKRLKKSIGRKLKTYKGAARAVAVIGPRIGSHAGYHGHLVERGHKIVPPKNRRLKTSTLVRLAATDHASRLVPPHPFLEPVYDAHKKTIPAQYAAELKKRIESAAQK